MKTQNNLRLIQYFTLFLFILCSFSTYAQLELVPLPREQASQPKKNGASRTQAVTPRKLPFWDDFSFSNKSFVQDSLWFSGQSVWINNGMGINPPSLGVATFDGLDSLGKPYNVNDVLAKGYADNVTSQPLRMDLIDPSLRATVFTTFFYQFQGNGEAPDAGDSLFLQFKNKTAQWETVWSRNNDGTLDKSIFYQVTLPITADRFYHEGFQFRFRNYARLSGPYDTWNLDYVFVSNGHVSDLPPPFPDRTIVSPLTSMFENYTALPVKHFLADTAKTSTYLIKPSFIISNRRSDQLPPNGAIPTKGQPINYVADAIITTKKGGVVLPQESINLNNNDVSEGTIAEYNVFTPITLRTIPAKDKFDPGADSISIKIKVKLSSDDNVVKTATEGDYIPLIYSPIDFRINDTTSNIFTLSDYYAYDDGSAEYGASLKGAGAQLAYQFEKKTDRADALKGVYLYFPRFGTESAQIIQLQIFRDLLGSDTSQLYNESMTIALSQQNRFIYHPLTSDITIHSKNFYIGWKQSTSTNVIIGLDKNTDSGTKIYFNTNGSWQQNTLTKGSLLMRPVFGGEVGTVVGLPEEQKVSAYPNPNNGVFFLPPEAYNIHIIDITGKQVDFIKESNMDSQQINIQDAVMGMYIVRFVLNEQIITQKIIVKQ